MMRKILLFLFLIVCSAKSSEAQSYETRFSKSLSRTLGEIETRFQVKLKCEVDTVGKIVPFADFRIRPYSLEESLANVLAMFDYKFVKQDNKFYKIRAYEYARRTPEDGKKMLAFLNTLYVDSSTWKSRKDCLRNEVREKLQVDNILQKRVGAKPLLSEVRKYNGYSVQNFALETLPGLFVCGSIYNPLSKGKHALILCPNGHWQDGRYNADEQYRFATLARMGAACVSYDLFGWGESEWQVSYIAHRTSVAQILQLVNGISILDYLLARPDIDAARIGANGGSGGGTQVVQLSVLDDRISAACPTVSLASHFDGGCPCESGMPVQLACGGTNNAELLATFAPKPLCVISDGKDWTATVPDLEYPYLQRIYGFYQAVNRVSNIHLPEEGHDFGPNKRKAVYDFFGRTFGLNSAMLDESKVVIEPKEAMYSFGIKGEKMPAHAIRSYSAVEKFFNKIQDQKITSDIDLEKKASVWVDSLKLQDPGKEVRVKAVILEHLKAVRDWNNEHPSATVPEGINPFSGNPLSVIDREVIANSARPKSIHERLMAGLRKELTAEEVEKVLDFYTIGKVAFTMKGYYAIVPDLTSEEAAVILGYLKEAREMAVDYKSMKQISAIFEIYKTKSEQYLNSKGRNWRALFKAYVDSVKAKKEAEKASKNK
jgi:hypothetical protein